VNELIDKQSISIDGKEIFLGGDMKFLLMIMGLNSATADYAYLWCKIFKEERWDTSRLLLRTLHPLHKKSCQLQNVFKVKEWKKQ